MGEAEITPDVVQAAFKVDPGHALIEEDDVCWACADPFEVDQQALLVRAPLGDTGRYTAVTYIHLRCYQGEVVRHD